MANQKIKFENATGQMLDARLELPVDQKPHTYAIFAHCFTCNKNLSAVRNISRSLNQNGIAVLRFDFTGLGESEGDHLQIIKNSYWSKIQLFRTIEPRLVRRGFFFVDNLWL